MLTDSKIRSAKPHDKTFKITDSHGLYLLVSTSGSRLWYFRYRFDGKENRLALGDYPQISLAEGISPSRLSPVTSFVHLILGGEPARLGMITAPGRP